MGAGADYNGDGEPISAINVTPLVDVMLVLLVIFMVTAPMLQQGVEVDLPKATSAPLKGSTEQVVISIDKAGEVYVGAGNKVLVTELADKIKGILDAKNPNDRKVYIKGDNQLNYGRIMEVMASLHAGGVTQIGLVSGVPDGNTPEKGSKKAG